MFLDGLEIDVGGHSDCNVEGGDTLVFAQISQVEELSFLNNASSFTHEVADK